MAANFVNQGRIPLATRSAAHRRISAPFCTESFQRYGSSTPTLKRPITGLRPITARYSFAFMPIAQGGIRPRRAWRSATSIGASSPLRFMSSGLVAPPPVFGIRHESGLIARIASSHTRHSSKRRDSFHSR